MAGSDEVKICIICHQDCSNAPRYRTDLGEYVHQFCYEEESALVNEKSEGSDHLNVTDKLSWKHYVYCLNCERPWQEQYCDAREERKSGSDGSSYLITRYYCKNCGSVARQTAFELYAWPPLAQYLMALFSILVLPVLYLLGIDSGILPFFCVPWALIMAFQGFSGSKLRKSCIQIHTEWVRKYGIDPKNWRNT